MARRLALILAALLSATSFVGPRARPPRPALRATAVDRSPEALAQDAAKLLGDVAAVAGATGLDVGLRRGLQAAQAAAATAAEVLRKPPKELDEAFAGRPSEA